MTSRDHLQTAERDFMAIAETVGLPEPDEINYREDQGEVELIWREHKLAVVVECEPDCPF